MPVPDEALPELTFNGDDAERSILRAVSSVPARDLDKYSTMFDPIKPGGAFARLNSFCCSFRRKGRGEGSALLPAKKTHAVLASPP